MVNNINDDVVVVIRSVGERTVGLCYEIVSQKLNKENIFIIEEVPFEAAVRKSFQIGILSGKKWLFVIDADIIPRVSAFDELYLASNSIEKKVMMFTGVVYDKLLMSYRRAGIKVYRCEHLKEAIDCVPEPGTKIRPEKHTLMTMLDKGFKIKQTSIVTGIHDFEQYYKDIYRTCFVHAVKQPHIISLIKTWQSNVDLDSDCRIAIKGALDGYLEPQKATIDKRIYVDLALKAMHELGLEEKTSLNIKNSTVYVDNILIKAGTYSSSRIHTLLIKQLHEKGIYEGLKYTFGSLVLRIGRKLTNYDS